MDSVVAATRALSLNNTLISLFQQLIRCQNTDFLLVAVEDFDIPCEDLTNSVGLHRGYEASVVSFFTGNLMLNDQTLPVLMHGGCIRAESGKLLKILELLGGFDSCHA